MITIPLASIANQSFSDSLDGTLYQLRLISRSGLTYVDIIKDDITVLTAQRAEANTFLIPYRYLEQGDGNFAFLTANDEYPTYTEFGVTQTLVYLTNDEINRDTI